MRHAPAAAARNAGARREAAERDPSEADGGGRQGNPSADPREPGGYWESVLAPAESIYDGTWSGHEPVPEEIVDFELMGGENIALGWRELNEIPPYVRRFCIDLLNIKRRCIAERANRGQ